MISMKLGENTKWNILLSLKKVYSYMKTTDTGSKLLSVITRQMGYQVLPTTCSIFFNVCTSNVTIRWNKRTHYLHGHVLIFSTTALLM